MAHWAAMPDDVVTMGFYNLETYDNYAYQTVNGITFGYLSYTEHTNGLPTPSGTDYGVVYLDDHETIAKQIADMRPNCDVLIVSAHMGTEGTHEVNDFQRETAQWLADQGVDVIIGTHPHVVQNAAWLTGVNGNTTFIVYSLGNFINAQSSRDNVIGAILDVYFDKTTQPDGSVSIAIRDPKLHCVISQYEAGYKNIRVIPYSQYTDELGAAHGEFTLSREYIESMLRSTIDEEFPHVRLNERMIFYVRCQQDQQRAEHYAHHLPRCPVQRTEPGRAPGRFCQGRYCGRYDLPEHAPRLRGGFQLYDEL